MAINLAGRTQLGAFKRSPLGVRTIAGGNNINQIGMMTVVGHSGICTQDDVDALTAYDITGASFFGTVVDFGTTADLHDVGVVFPEEVTLVDIAEPLSDVLLQAQYNLMLSGIEDPVRKHGIWVDQGAIDAYDYTAFKAWVAALGGDVYDPDPWANEWMQVIVTLSGLL